jgi:methyl-accepting chemotaxis protein
MSAKAKLLLLIFIMTSTIISIVSLIGYQQFKSASVSASNISLQQKSFLISKALEEKMNRMFDTLTVISKSIHFDDKGELADINKTNDSLAYSNLLTKLSTLKEHFGVLNAYVGVKDGKTYAINKNGIIPNFNAVEKQREWYVRAFKGEKKIITTPYLSASKNLVMAVAVPIIQTGKVVGVLSINLSLEEITNFVKSLDQNNQVYVSRNDGFVLAANDKEFIGTSIFEQIPQFKEFKGGDGKEESYDYKGNTYVVINALSPELEWTVWAWESLKSIESASNRNLLISSVLAVIFILISLILAYLFIHRLMYLPIGGEPKEIGKIVERVANGDLSIEYDKAEARTGIYAEIILMVQSLRKVMLDINQTANLLDKSSLEILDSANQVNTRSEAQMQKLEHAVTSMNEMTTTVDEIARNAVHAEGSADSANSFVSEGKTTVDQMNVSISNLVSGIEEVQTVINELERESKNVGSILDVIKGISEQTNLLALNAAIEAARAGDSGRGFAVVADEVRELANKTSQSTNKIQEVIDSLQVAAKTSVDLMDSNASRAIDTGGKSEEANQALSNINDSTMKIKDMNSSIATAAEEQATVAQHINSSIDEINDLAKLTSENSLKNKQLAQGVSDISNELKQSVSSFKL